MFWTMAGSVISRGLTFIAGVFVARMLGKTGYGEFGMINSTVGMFGIFAGFGLGITATKHVAELRQKDPARAGRILGLSWIVAMVTGGVMALALFLFAPWLAQNTINAPHLAGVLKVGALILLISALNGAQSGALSGFEAFKTLAYINLFIGIISFPLLICGAYLGGLTGVVWAMTINVAISWIINHIAIRKEAAKNKVPLTFSQCTKELPVLWQFSLPSVLSGLMVTPVFWLCNTFLVNQPNGYAEMGIFTACLVFQNLLIFSSSMLDGPLMSIVANAGENISSRLGTVNMVTTWVLGVMVAIPLLCFPEIPNAIFGAGFKSKSFTITFAFIIFNASFTLYKAGLARVITARNLLWWSVLSNFLWGILAIGCAKYFVKWGAPGLAAAFACAYIINTLIFIPFYFSRNLVPKNTIVSVEALLIWSVITFLVFLNIIDVSLLCRSIMLLPGLAIVYFAFKRIIITKETQLMQN
jgi:O-antigen/teichoic acid export membrane protein